MRNSAKQIAGCAQAFTSSSKGWTPRPRHSQCPCRAAEAQGEPDVQKSLHRSDTVPRILYTAPAPFGTTLIRQLCMTSHTGTHTRRRAAQFQPMSNRVYLRQVLWNRTGESADGVSVRTSLRSLEPFSNPSVYERATGLMSLLRDAATGPPSSFASTFPLSLGDLNDLNWLLVIVFLLACVMVGLVIFSNLWPHIHAALSLDFIDEYCGHLWYPLPFSTVLTGGPSGMGDNTPPLCVLQSVL